jgi:hypothetical protein
MFHNCFGDASSRQLGRRSLFGVLALSALTACTTTPYQVPQGADTAMVRFRSNTGDHTFFRIVDLSQCPDGVRSDFVTRTIRDDVEVSGLAMYGSSTQALDNVRERKIGAGKRVIVTGESMRVAVQYVPGYKCSSGVAFTPQAGRQYEISYILDSGRCGVRVFQLTQTLTGQLERRLDPDARPVRISSDTNYCAQW